jgi:hypothetical protein
MRNEQHEKKEGAKSEQAPFTDLRHNGHDDIRSPCRPRSRAPACDTEWAAGAETTFLNN